MSELSIVMAARNDNYGGQVYRDGYEPAVPTLQKDRMRLSLFTLHEAFKDIDYEVILVEWNPPEDREKISEWDFMAHPGVRIIEVPKEFSDKVLEPHIDFHEMWAKNVGIRRARGNFILGTNPDILWLKKMGPITSLGPWTPMISYRWTVYHPVLDLGLDIDKIIDYCSDESNRIDYNRDSNGDFTLLKKEEWYKLQGYSITFPGWAGCDMQQVRRAAEMTRELGILPFPIFHVRHPGRALASGYDMINVSEDWGAPNEDFTETVWEFMRWI